MKKNLTIICSILVLGLVTIDFQGRLSIGKAKATSVTWPITSYETSSEISGWESEKLFDNNTSTMWSSEQQSSASNSQKIIFEFDTYHDTNFIKLYPRYLNNNALSFPVNFTIEYSDGAQWNLVYQYENFPNPKFDWIILALPETINAKGIIVRADVLGTDNNGKYYFQLGEVAAGYDEGFKLLQFQGIDADEGINLIENVEADAFNPNKISNWNYDYRMPLLKSNCVGKENIYAPHAELVGAQWYVYYGGMDSVPGSTCDYENDRLYMTFTDKKFQNFDDNQRRKIIDEGPYFLHTNNLAIARTPPETGYWGAMVYTAAWHQNDGKKRDKPAYALSTDGINWIPENPGNPNETNTLLNIDNYHIDWETANINGQNAFIYDDGQYWYYYAVECLGYRAYATNIPNFTEDGSIYNGPYYDETGKCQTGKAINDIKKFRWNGADYYFFVSHTNSDHVYYSLSTDPSWFPDEQILFSSMALTEGKTRTDDYIVSAGILTDGMKIYGVLYGASDTSNLNKNKIFAKWLQKKVYFSNSRVGWGSIERADGPNKIRLAMDAPNSIETGKFYIYDSDGTTLLFESSDVTIISGMRWKFNNEDPCGPPNSGDWVITENCALTNIKTAPSNVIVKNNATLTVENSGSLDIDFKRYHLKVEKGSSVMIKQGGRLN